MSDLVHVNIDGVELDVAPGTLVIRAAEQAGIEIPRFCDHPLLAPAGACRQCLVDVEGQRKPMASCTTTVSAGMVVHTQHTSDAAEKAQRGVMELLLINHPLDCPVCDKGGECPLQNQAMSTGRTQTRFTGTKRTYPKPFPLSTEVLLDRERCVLCARCTRFADEVAGDPLIELTERGAQQQVGIAEGEPFNSYFSGNTVQICPVGALTGTAYRFRARPFDLVSTQTVCEHCSAGCAQRTDHRRGTVLRRLAGDDPAVNEEWNCDKGRWAFTSTAVGDRITAPRVRDADGALRDASWSEAIDVAAAGLAAAAGVGVLTGGRLTVEDAYGYAKFARIVLGSNDIDLRARPHSAEEADFLAATATTVTYADLDNAPAVLLVGLEPEEECPIVFLRLRKAVRNTGLSVRSIAPWASPGLTKLGGELIRTVPGAEANALDALTVAPGTIVLVGERLATSVGAYSAVHRLAQRTGAQLAWVPRRAGEPGALAAGCLPTLLPGGRPVADAEARAEVAAAWNVSDLPAAVGRDTAGQLAAAAAGQLGALLLAGVEAADLPDPAAALAAVAACPFVVSIEVRESAITERADVVFPAAPVAEKAGTFVNWEGRWRPFAAALNTAAGPDLRVLQALADELGVELGLPDAAAARAELAKLGSWSGTSVMPDVPAGPAPAPGPEQAVLAGWRMLLDAGRGQDGEPHLAGTARPAVARMSAATAAGIGADDGEMVTVSTASGALTLPLTITDMVDAVVWLPLNSPPATVHATLVAAPGTVVNIARAAH